MRVAILMLVDYVVKLSSFIPFGSNWHLADGDTPDVCDFSSVAWVDSQVSRG